MAEVYSFEDFLNEGLFRSKHKDLVKYIYDHIQRINTDKILRKNYNGEYNQFNFCIRNIINKNHLDIDPYGEEDWIDDEDMVVTLIRKPKYELFIDDNRVDVTTFESRKLFKAADKKLKDERDRIINDAMRRHSEMMRNIR